MEKGYRHVRVQVDIPGLATYGSRRPRERAAGSRRRASRPTRSDLGAGPLRPHGSQAVRAPAEHLGDDVELLHDVHERISPSQAISLCKELEKYRLFFLEDPLSPEDKDHFRLLRQQTSTPLAMGELFNTQQEYVPLITERLIDFIRIHISQIGGLSMARKVAALCEFFGVKTAWHGPGDVSPVGHAAGLALELASYNFGIHEGEAFAPETREVFPGCPEIKDGYIHANDGPGLGIDIDEKLAARFPLPAARPSTTAGAPTRRRDGTMIRP